MSCSVFMSNSTLSSALRFGLSPIKPVEETYEKKIGKFKLIHKITHLVPKKKYSYKEYSALFYEEVLRNISTPPKFQIDEIHKYLVKQSSDFLNKIGLDGKIKKLENLRADNGEEVFEKQHDIMIDLTMELSSLVSREEESKFYSQEFLNSSNFQFSFFAELMRGSRTYNKFLNIMEHELRLLKGLVKASFGRGTMAAMKRYRRLTKGLRPIVDVCDSFRLASSTLKTYVEICNSNTVEEIYKLKPLDASKLEESEFNRLFESYKIRLDYLEKILIEKKPELFVTQIDFNQPVNDMWRKLLTVNA